MAGLDQVRARVDDHGAASAAAGSVRNCRIDQTAPRSSASWPSPPSRSSSPATSTGGPVRAPPGQRTTTCSPLGYSAHWPRRLRAEQVGAPSGISPVREDDPEVATRTLVIAAGWSLLWRSRAGG